jgi:hypothetical protein
VSKSAKGEGGTTFYDRETELMAIDVDAYTANGSSASA